MKRRNYSGPLAKPIVVTAPKNLAKIIPSEIFQVTSDEQNRLILAAWASKIDLLFAHYGLDENSKPWMDLALDLAVAHVPGFDVRYRQSGAPVKNSHTDLVRLAEYVDRIAEDRRAARQPSSYAKICELLASDPKFKAMFPKLANTSSRTLRNLLSQARKSKKGGRG